MEDLFKLLKAINKHPITNQRDLANSINISVGKVNSLLRDADREGYILISKQGKSSVFSITAKGKELLEKTLLNHRETKLMLVSEGEVIKTAVILATSRIEDFKGSVSLFALEENKIIDRNIAVLENSGIEKIILVAGYHYKELKDYLSNKQNVTVVENPRYKWSGTMYGLSLVKDLLDEDFLLLKGDIVFEQQAVIKLLEEQNPFSTVIASPSGHGDEAFVELDSEGNIFRISKDIHQINKVQGELLGIAKISTEVFEKMLEYFSENQNDFLNFEYVLENIGRIYRFTGVMVDDLIWSKIATKKQYDNLVKIVYPRILRKEKEMKEKIATDTIMEILSVTKDEIDDVYFAGGLTNTNYYVEVKGNKYILRLPGRMTESMISRVNEKKNAQIASDYGFNCSLVYCNEQTGIKLSEYINNAETLNSRTVKLETNMKLTAKILKQLHTSDIVFENRFNPFEETVKYEGLCDFSTAKIFDGYHKLRERVFALQKRLDELGYEQKPCHNDLVAENLVKDGNGRLYLIDWEYSGINDPMVDVAALFLENEFSQEDEELFFSYYFEGENVDIAPYREKIFIFKITLDFLWSIWTVVKEAKGDDYGSYGQDRFDRALKMMDEWESNHNFNYGG